MRISDQQIVAMREYQVNASYERLAQTQHVVSTDRKINAPSDDPYGTAVALRLQGSLDQNTAFSSAASDTLTWMQTTTTALSGVRDALTKARTIAVQGANGTLTPDELDGLAANIGQLVQQGIQSANADYAGRYVLGGFQTGKPPFSFDSSTGTATYNGDNGAMMREISPGVTMQVNTPGSTAVPAALAAMIQLQKDLQSGNSTAIGGADLTAIDQANDGLLVTEAGVGAGTTRISSLQTTLQTQQTTLKAQYSNIVDADYAQASIDYNAAEATYQAAITVAGKSVEPSLLSFLK